MASLVLNDLSTFGPQGSRELTEQEAIDYARNLTHSQYENFTVVSWFLPKNHRPSFYSIYAFCRWADDLGDETGDPARSLELLDWWRHELDLCYQGSPRHPVYIALAKTIEQHDIPRKPFDDLIDAFVQDQRVTRYDTWDQVLDYCTRSADPVGRLVLYVCGYRDDQRQQLSDLTCTGLQLANFWQDVRRDIIERNRVYLPRDIARQAGLDIDLMAKAVHADHARTCDLESTGSCPCSDLGPNASLRALLPAYRKALAIAVERTDPFFTRGRSLLPLLDEPIRSDIKLFSLGGERVLKMIRRQRFDTLTSRPSISKLGKAGLILRVLAGKLLPSR